MGISFGSTSKKPYVGSKEVKEAYVGSQLVYRAKPPYKYYFLGGEESYFIDNSVISWVGSLTNITKYQNKFRIACDTSSGGYGQIDVNLNTPFYFSAARSGTFTISNKVTVAFRDARGYSKGSVQFDLPNAGEFVQFNVTPPSGSAKCNIVAGQNAGVKQYLYVDEICQINE